jgi:hypothetical protein
VERKRDNLLWKDLQWFANFSDGASSRTIARIQNQYALTIDSPIVIDDECFGALNGGRSFHCW